MNSDQYILFSLIGLIFIFLIWGKVRYDIVAFASLVLAFILGVIPQDRVFSGFGHPAVVIIALVLIVSRGLALSGAVELLARWIVDSSRSLQAHIGTIAGISAALSAVMNNVAALALLMPVDMQAARRAKRSPALSLMPLSFASILGGMVTMLGTPPNIVIATFRKDALGEPYSMFDFTPVGLVVATTGVLYVALVGWRLIPVDRRRRDTTRELEDVNNYVSDARVTESSPAIGKRLREMDSLAGENDINVVGLIRRGKRFPGTGRLEMVRKNDLVVMEGSPEDIDSFVGAAGLEYVKSGKSQGITSEAEALVEAVVPEGSWIVGRSAMDIRLLYSRGVTLLGISRKGKRLRQGVRKTPIKAGDILLLLGAEERMPELVDWLGCLALAGRGLEVIQRKKAWMAAGIFAAAIIAASMGLLYLPLALAAVVVAYVGLKIVPLSHIYEAVEWPVIVLLGSMIPLGAALESSGGTEFAASVIVKLTAGMPVIAVLAIMMIVTMTLSDVLNNVATALIAAPIGVDIAYHFNVNPDTFLMAVAVASSCAFLTPIGHKNNTIILGPGGYKFGDYWRMGLPLEVLVLLTGLPAILFFWPL